MPDHRKHRGPHPQDLELFSADNLPRLRSATSDLCWLLSRGYASNSAIKLVGDRYGLVARQRIAMGRCACGDQQALRRSRHELKSDDLVDQELWIDGFNVLTTVEASLAGGLILKSCDGCYRDMASMHGSYKRVTESEAAIGIIGQTVENWQVRECHWWLDQPVSNSGRLKTMLREVAQRRGWNWSVDLVPDPDAVLKTCCHVVASADSVILDHADRWFNLARAAVEKHVRDIWMVDLSLDHDPA